MKGKMFAHVATLIVLTAMSLHAQRPASDNRGDARIAREVRHELVMLPYYSVFDDLTYKVENSKVTLMGQVRNATLKDDAERAVKDIEGVERVENQIEVLPLSNTDDQIRRAVYYSLYGQNSSLFRYGWGAVPPIHIIVKNSRVTLTGVVDSEGDKTTAGMMAQKVPGTFGVQNELRVEKAEGLRDAPGH